MNELERYKLVIEQIQIETEMMGKMKFDTEDLERDLMAAHNLKINLYCRNVLSTYEAKEAVVDP